LPVLDIAWYYLDVQVDIHVIQMLERGKPSMKKTLWILDYGNGQLVMIYAEDEQAAWSQAKKWASERNISLPPNATMTHFPRGFQLNTMTLPGTVE
jgi:hypothetical protein